MGTPTRLTAADLGRALATYRDLLRSHQAYLNRLNVYPVPDGDTGTNMALTLDAVVAELETATDTASTCKAISHGSLMGARGNSGVILSQVLRGLVDGWKAAGDDGCDGAAIAAALTGASEAAYSAVQRPVEGTILTVARGAAEAATAAAGDGGELLGVLEAAEAGADEALARTPELLPVLARAGVVDAGGAGLCLLLHALLHTCDGRAVPDAPEAPAAAADAVAGDVDIAAAHDSVSDLRYEVMYFLEAPDETIPAFRDVWAGIGDSIVVVGGDGIWNCHIHTDDIGAAIEAAVDCGRPRRIRVTDLMEQVEEERWVREAADVEPDESAAAAAPVTTAVVAVATGDGVRRIFRSLGVQQIVAGGQSMNPSTAQILEAVEAAPASDVVVLPNNKNIIAVAEQVQQLTDKHVEVVRTTGMAEGFAALLAYDPETGGADNGAAMAEAAERVISAEVTCAVRDTDSAAGPITQGDWLGITRAGIEAVEPSVWEACTSLLTKLVTDDHEIVTLIEGEGSSAADTRRITEWLADTHSHVAAEVHHGGQPLYPYLISIE
ncbi:MAG TPA: DAK2 domain-containing protein [Acidimicrobiales bacterium]|nr:DAK2 domain-containing protein [Acidimicrobiales bacterium]